MIDRKFDLRPSENTSQFDKEDLVLAGGGLKLVIQTIVNPGTNWTSYKMALHELAGWRIGATAAKVSSG